MIFLRALIIVTFFGTASLFAQPATEAPPQKAEIKDEKINDKLNAIIKQAEMLLMETIKVSEEQHKACKALEASLHQEQIDMEKARSIFKQCMKDLDSTYALIDQLKIKITHIKKKLK